MISHRLLYSYKDLCLNPVQQLNFVQKSNFLYDLGCNTHSYLYYFYYLIYILESFEEVQKFSLSVSLLENRTKFPIKDPFTFLIKIVHFVDGIPDF